MATLTIQIYDHFAALKNQNASLFPRLNDVQITTEHGADVKLVFHGELRDRHKEMLNDKDDSPFRVTHMEGKFAWVTVPEGWKDSTDAPPAAKPPRTLKDMDIRTRIKNAFSSAHGGRIRDIVSIEPVGKGAATNEWKLVSTREVAHPNTANYKGHKLDKAMRGADNKTLLFVVPDEWLTNEDEPAGEAPKATYSIFSFTDNLHRIEALMSAHLSDHLDLGDRHSISMRIKGGIEPDHQMVDPTVAVEVELTFTNREDSRLPAAVGQDMLKIVPADLDDTEKRESLAEFIAAKYVRLVEGDGFNQVDPNPNPAATTVDVLDTLEVPAVVAAVNNPGNTLIEKARAITSSNDVLDGVLGLLEQFELMRAERDEARATAQTNARMASASGQAHAEVMKERDDARAERDAAQADLNDIKTRDARLTSSAWTFIQTDTFNAMADQIATLQAQVQQLTEINREQSKQLGVIPLQPIERKVVAQYIPMNGHTSIGLKEVEKAEREGWRIVARNVATKDGHGLYYLHEMQRFAPEEPVKPLTIDEQIEQVVTEALNSDEPIRDGLDDELEPEFSAAEAALDALAKFYQNPLPTAPLVIAGTATHV